MFFNPDDDDDGFTPNKRSNLASLFDSDKRVDKQSSSLVYTAPKQPKRHSTGDAKGENKAAQSAVMLATVVHAYKFEHNQHLHQGKLGIAVIGSHESNNYMLLLYKTKQQTIAKAHININFTFTAQDNNYANFYDDQRISWSINFDTRQSAIDFAKQVALAKVNSVTPHLESVIIQDLISGQGSTIESGDVVGITYTGWILSNRSFGQVFDTNEDAGKPFTIKVGTGKMLKEVEAAMVGMKNDGRRLIIIPPSLGYGAQGLESIVPANATLIFSVFVKAGGHSTRSSTTLAQDADTKKTENTSVGESVVKAHGSLISEQLQNMSPKSDKAQIISRMAKMGQPMLPLPGAIIAQPLSSESDAEEDLKTSHHSPSPEPLPKPLPRLQAHTKQPVSSTVGFDSNLMGTPPIFSSYGVIPGHHVTQIQTPPALTYPIATKSSVIPGASSYVLGPIVSGQPFMSPSTTVDSHVPVLLTEVKAQNSELRLHICQMVEKVDRILGKLDQPSMYPIMEAGILAHNIQRVIQENDSMKNELKEKSQKIETLTDKMTNLLQHNQKFLEQSSTMLEQRCDLQSSSVQTLAKLSAVEKEKNELLIELNEAKGKIIELQVVLGDHTNIKISENNDEEINTMKSENATLNLECQSLQKSCNDIKQCLKSTEEALRQEQLKTSDLEIGLKTLNNTYETLQHQSRTEREAANKEIQTWMNKFQEAKETIERLKLQHTEGNTKQPETLSDAHSNADIIDAVKKIMNATYRSLQKQFNGTETYAGQMVKEVLATTIRAVTLELMDHFSTSVTPQPSSVSEKSTTEGINSTATSHETGDKIVSHQTAVTHSDETNVSKSRGEIKDNKVSNPTPPTPHNDDTSESWKPQPPPLCDEPSSDADDDDWLN